MSASFRVDQIDHVELLVPDRYAAAQWYQHVFGLEIIPEFEYWAQDPNGPLMISSDGGSTKLALFTGDPSGTAPSMGWHRLAFRVNGDDFLAFLRRLDTLELLDHNGARLTANRVVDHEQSWSIYFPDPYGNRFEITTYDYAHVAQALTR